MLFVRHVERSTKERRIAITPTCHIVLAVCEDNAQEIKVSSSAKLNTDRERLKGRDGWRGTPFGAPTTIRTQMIRTQTIEF